MGTLEQQKWIAKLLGYEYEILYKLERENNIADALSRLPLSPQMDSLYPIISYMGCY